MKPETPNVSHATPHFWREMQMKTYLARQVDLSRLRRSRSAASRPSKPLAKRSTCFTNTKKQNKARNHPQNNLEAWQGILGRRGKARIVHCQCDLFRDTPSPDPTTEKKYSKSRKSAMVSKTNLEKGLRQFWPGSLQLHICESFLIG